uniref:Epoxide hydrolase N-terminal domain-containing protein n=1 Tax=Micrurus lemniscatus lemniscatus TaxID=129467 RepID=A0A2D4HJY5_MICLE
MMLLELIMAAVLGTIIYLFLNKTKEEVLPMGDGWWAAGAKPDSEEDTTIRPFKVVTSEEEIQDLHQRLDKARFAEPLEDSYFHYGFNATYLKKKLSLIGETNSTGRNKWKFSINSHNSKQRLKVCH